MITSYATYLQYFMNLAENHRDIKQHVVGNAERILSEERSSLTYPVMWLEDPDVSLSRRNEHALNFSGAFVILMNAQQGNFTQEQYNLQRTWEIINDVLHKMLADAEDIGIEYQDINIDPIDTINHNDFGWRLEFNIPVPLSHCVDSDRWSDVCPVDALASFAWDNANAGDFTSLTITNNSLPAGHGWTWEWTWNIDDGADQTSNAETPSISSAGNYIYIQLKISDGNGCVRYASAYFENGISTGNSVPYIHKPK